MTVDRRLFKLNDKYDIAADSNQWMIRKIRTVKGEEKPQALWFIGCHKRGLYKGIGKHRIKVTDAARRALDSLPTTFTEWSFLQAQGEL